MNTSILRGNGSAPSPRGAASLIVVLLLFLVLSLTAAYTSRNLVFEQKTSANQARSTAAFEAAEAGVEWALTQLNGARVDNACVESAIVGDLSFQNRYLTIAPDGFISQTLRAGGALTPQVWPTCVFNGNNWSCSCPVDAAVLPVAPVGAGSFPAFRVWPGVRQPLATTASPWTVNLSPNPGLIALTVAGCTRLPTAATETCLDYMPRGEIGEGLSIAWVRLALRSGLPTSPSAAITARMNVEPDNTPGVPKLQVVNTDTRSKGLTVNTGNPPLHLLDQSRFAATTLPGTPSEMSFAPDDTQLKRLEVVAPAANAYGAALTKGDRMFVMTFGMKRQTYREQPGLRRCPAVCTAAVINTLLADNPNRIIWVDDDLTLDADIGSAATPVLLIVNGEILRLGDDVDIYGFVYLTGGATELATIELPDTATSITGAVVAEGRLATLYAGVPAAASRLTVTYDRAVMDRLRTTYGSWVRVPGSWRDFRDPLAPP